jgi:hypothetical protein
MAFYPAHIRAFQEHFFIQERRKIHESLNSNIFEKIAKYGFEGNYVSPIHRLKINYDLSKLRESSDYEEAKAHWEQDLKGIETDPEKIESKVKGLNQDIKEFFTTNLQKHVISAIEANFTAFDKTDIPPSNQVSIPNVIKRLERDWIESSGVDIHYDPASRRYDLDGVTIAIIEPQHEVKLNHIIKSLKSKDSPIDLAIQSFRLRRNTILKAAEMLNKEMDERIINVGTRRPVSNAMIMLFLPNHDFSSRLFMFVGFLYQSIPFVMP